MASDLHTAPINDLTFDDVVAFCSEQRPESIRLEYKADFSDTKSKIAFKIAKEVCALANTRGGLLIYGVEEAENRYPNPTPQGQELVRQRYFSSSLAGVMDDE